MTANPNPPLENPCRCCASPSCSRSSISGVNRREFLVGTGAVTGLALASIGAYAQGKEPERRPPINLPLKAQPVLFYHLFQKRDKTSWRPWGGLHTEQDAADEKNRIREELKKMAAKADFPLEVLPLATVQNPDQAAAIAKGNHDVLIQYAVTGDGRILEALTNPQKWTLMFVRHRSGPVYEWYEIAHNRFLRKTVDQFGQPGMDVQDVVVDNPDELLWRLKALHGLKNTLGKKILAVGGAGGWGQGGQKAPELAKKIWKLDIQDVPYPALGERIKKARQNDALVKRTQNAAEKYLQQQGTELKTGKIFVDNAFLLCDVFRDLLDEAQTDAITINACMGTIMPISETTACLPLSLLNDDGYMAFCESDFVVIPAGILLHGISRKPMFLNDPTYPHDGVVTLAHCTAPRKMDGKQMEPVKILTHYESDYGAAPKVEMKLGQKITTIDPDFDGKKWVGFEGEVIGNPFYDICRSQIDIQINGDCDKLLEEMKGFHWMVSYGNYLRETGYALKKVGIEWINLTNTKKA